MATQFLHRLLIVVPAARVAAFATWYRVNVDPQGDVQVGPALNASGLASDPVTHRWMCGAYVDAACRVILGRLCSISGVTPPTAAQWNGWTRAEKRSWVQGAQAGILAGCGVWVGLAPNDGTWDAPETALTALGLKRIASGP